METVILAYQWVMAHYQQIIAGLMAICTGLIAIFMLIPGAEPEATLQKIVDFLSKYSAK